MGPTSGGPARRRGADPADGHRRHLLALPGGIALAGLAWRYGGLVRRLLFLWAEIIRGIPLIFVIFWLWYLLPMLTGGDLPGAVTVTLALAWFTAASVMHSVLAGLQSLPKGQYEAALTQGFAPGQTLRLVLLPQALRNVQPSLLGIFIGLLKDTSLAFIVNVPELTTVAGQVNNRVQIYPRRSSSSPARCTTCCAAV